MSSAMDSTDAAGLTSRLRPDDFKIGWICALPHELAASRAMLDVVFDLSDLDAFDPADENSYTIGSIGFHNIVMACLPTGKYGNESAAAVARDLKRTFPSIEFSLMVGIGGGVPSRSHDIRLGDIVVSRPTLRHGGVIQYDMGKVLANGTFERRGHLNKPPLRLLNALSALQATHEAQPSSAPKILDAAFTKTPTMRAAYSMPSHLPDQLFEDDSPASPEVFRAPRHSRDPVIHYGLIASGNRVIASKDEQIRLKADEPDILCFEMEAAGLMDTLPSLAIRGICDYADARKQDGWQKYSAMTAAAYARELLLSVSSKAGRSGIPNAESHRARSSRTSPAAPLTSPASPFTPPASSFTTPVASFPLETRTTFDSKTPLASFEVPFTFDRVKPAKAFVGRGDELMMLKDFFKPDLLNSASFRPQRRLFTVIGGGGLGKTQLCLKYVRDYQRHHTAVLWLNGTSDVTVKQSFRDILVKLHEHDAMEGASPQAMGDDEVIRAVLAWLSLKENHRWLMVLDNVDLDKPDPQAYDVETYVPQVDHGAILITSRLRSLQRLGGSLELETLSKPESRMILENQIGHSLEGDQAAEKIVDRLQGLPLALTLAGAYVGSTGCSLAEYVEAYDQQWKDLVEFQDEDLPLDYGRPMLTTWATSYNQVQNQSPDAARLLDLWSFLDPTSLKHELIIPAAADEWRHHSQPEWLTKIAKQRLMFNKEARLLSQFSLIRHGGGDGSYSMHSVVHQWCFETLLSRSPDLCHSFCQTATNLLAKHFSGDRPGSVSWETRRRFLSHTTQLCRRLEPFDENSNTFQWSTLSLLNLKYLALQVFHLQKIDEATKMSEKVLTACEKVLGPKHDTTLDAVCELASCFIAQGRRDDTIEHMYQRAIEGFEEKKGPLRGDTLRAIHNLGRLYYLRGQHEKAEAMYVRSLEGNRETYGDSDHRTFNTMTNLGHLYVSLGNLEKAKEVAQDVFKGTIDANDMDAPSRHKVFRNVSSLCKDLGLLDMAEESRKQAILGEEGMFGPEHPITLGSYYKLASVLYDQDKIAEAGQMYERAWKGYEKTQGPEGRDTLDCASRVARMYAMQGRLAESRALREDALQKERRIFGPEHRYTLNTMFRLAETYMDMGDLAAADPLVDQVMQLYRKVEGPTHKHTLEAAYDLAMHYLRQGKNTKAEALLREALTGSQESLGVGADNTIDLTCSLGRVLVQQGRSGEAAELYRQTIEALTEAPDPDPQRVEYLNTLLSDLQPKSQKRALFGRMSRSTPGALHKK